MELKASSNLLLIAEYFLFQEKCIEKFWFSFCDLRLAILLTVAGGEIVFLDFPDWNITSII